MKSQDASAPQQRPETEPEREARRQRILSRLDALGERCFLCKWIGEDLRANAKLTGHPKDANGQAVFPVAGKVRHLELERPALEAR